MAFIVRPSTLAKIGQLSMKEQLPNVLNTKKEKKRLKNKACKNCLKYIFYYYSILYKTLPFSNFMRIHIYTIIFYMKNYTCNIRMVLVWNF